MISVEDHIEIVSDSIGRPSPPSLDHHFILEKGRNKVHLKSDILRVNEVTNVLSWDVEFQLLSLHDNAPLTTIIFRLNHIVKI